MLNTARRWRPDWFLLGMIAAALLAWLAPGPDAKGGALHPEVLNHLGVALIFFLHGLALSFAALRQGTLHWAPAPRRAAHDLRGVPAVRRPRAVR